MTGGDVVIIKCEADGSLTNHPAKKQVMDFLKNLVVDSLSLPPASKGPHTIDLLLEVKSIHHIYIIRGFNFQNGVVGW